jgi:hypothetical protein
MALVFLTLGFNSVSGQSKKEIIQYLQFKIDSMSSVFAELTQNQNLRIKSFEDEIIDLQKTKTDLNTTIKKLRDSLLIINAELFSKNKIVEVNEDINNQLKKQITFIENEQKGLQIHLKKLLDSLEKLDFKTASQLNAMELLKIENSELNEQLGNKPKTFYDVDFGIGCNFADPNHEGFQRSRDIGDYLFKLFSKSSIIIIQKEKQRIINSKYAKRINNNLHIASKNKEIVLKSDTLNYGWQQNFYSYLFEDTNNQKLYCAKIRFSFAVGFSELFSLVQIDLKTGKVMNEEFTDYNGNFYFNSSNNFVVISGWTNVGGAPFPSISNISVIDLDKNLTELKIEDSEIMNLQWVSDTSFKCQVIKYTQTMEPEPYFDRPVNYLIPFTLFTYENGKWISTKL